MSVSFSTSSSEQAERPRAAPTGGGGPAAQWWIRRVLFALSAVLLVAAILGAAFQGLRPDPGTPLTWLERWTTRPETNSWMRLNQGIPFPAVTPQFQAGPLVEDLKVSKGSKAGESLVVLALSDGSILRSPDLGSTWLRSQLPLPGPRSSGPVSLCFTEGVGYAVAGTRDLFRTQDQGKTWTPVGNVLPPRGTFQAVDCQGESVWASTGSELVWSGDGTLGFDKQDLARGSTAAVSPRRPAPGTLSLRPSLLPPAEGIRASLPGFRPPAERAETRGPPVSTPPSGRTDRRRDQQSPPEAPPVESAPVIPARPPDVRAREPGTHQVCGARDEVYVLAGEVVRRFNGSMGPLTSPAPFGTALKRCARASDKVVAVVDANGSLYSRSGPEAWTREPIAKGVGALAVENSRLVLAHGNGQVAAREILHPSAGVRPSPDEQRVPVAWQRNLRHLALNEGTWFAVDEDGGFWANGSGGRWERRSTLRFAFTTAFPQSDQELLVATSTGHLLRSRDAAETWEVEHAFEEPIALLAKGKPVGDRFLYALAPGWEQTRAGHAFDESDQAWSVLESFEDPGLLVHYPGGGRKTLLPDAGQERFTTARGISWTIETTGLITRDGPGISGTPLDAGSEVELHDLVVHDAAVWAVGDKGAILLSQDEGNTWKSQAKAVVGGGALSAVVPMAGGQRVVVFGEGGTLAWSDDGGESWQRPANTFGIPPWCHLAWLLAAAFSALGLVIRDRPRSPMVEGVQDVLVRDSPIEREEEDALGQAEVARAISYFLQNRGTQAPLTLAVTGEWGMGKSSVLNLIQRSLKAAGMPVVTFNAWHHQQEEDLLAALFARIVEGARPRGFAAAGFRSRLLFRRLRNRLWALMALVALLALGVAFQQKAPHGYLDRMKGDAAAVWTDWNTPAKRKTDTRPPSGDAAPLSEKKDEASPEAKEAASSSAKKEETSPGSAGATPPATTDGREKETSSNSLWAVLLLWLGSLSPFVLGLLRALRGFGVEPAALAAHVSSATNLKVEKKRVAFRARFAEEFAEVTDALGDRRLVLFIDDLDRCSGADLLKVLETINFLVSSGRCFVVLAMSRTIVLQNLAAELKGVAVEAPPMQEDVAIPVVDARLAHAERYLQKLINVEVPLPRLSSERAGAVLKGSTVGQTGSRFTLAHWARVAIALTMALVATGTGWRLGTLAGNAAAHAVPTLPPEAVTAPPPQADTKGSASASGSQVESAAPAAEPKKAEPLLLPEDFALETGGEPEADAWSILLWGLAFMAVLLVAGARAAPRPQVKDSRPFLDTLEAWSPVIQKAHPTPRALKRFLNQLRFSAMRLKAQKGQPMLSDEELVALSALAGTHPDFTRSYDSLRELVAVIEKGLATPQLRDDLAAFLRARGLSPDLARAIALRPGALRAESLEGFAALAAATGR